MVNKGGVGGQIFSQYLWATLAWDKIGVMFGFTQFAGTRSYEADCRLIPVRSYRLGRLQNLVWCLVELRRALVSSYPGLSHHL